jgi:LL-diaminopimelate aminotransferase
MAKVNANYKNLATSYLFSEISKRTKAFSEANPEVEILRLGIGNTTEAIVPAAISGLKVGVEKLSNVKTYTGYGDEQGNARLREAISNWYSKRKLVISADEVFVSDGAKTDCANISSVFENNSIVAVPDPVYPVYVDANIIGGKKIVYLRCGETDGFIPKPPEDKVDLIFLCSPNNPTGAVATKAQLKTFVDYAIRNKAVIIFDAAYSEYIQDKTLPKSIYEIEGAKKCAIEIQSFSKSAGFTGIRLGWTIVPKQLITEDSKEEDVNRIWNRRQTTMFNGASNVAQEGGLAVLSKEGQEQCSELVNYYMGNAKIIKDGIDSLGLKSFGGVNAPYIWVKCPNGFSSWNFFDKLLNEPHVVSTPGAGFGSCGEGYVRLSAFGHRENVKKAIESIRKNLKI